MSAIGGLSTGGLACVGDTITECCEPPEPQGPCCALPFVKFAPTGEFLFGESPAVRVVGDLSGAIEVSTTGGGDDQANYASPDEQIGAEDLILGGCGATQYRRAFAPTLSTEVASIVVNSFGFMFIDYFVSVRSQPPPGETVSQINGTMTVRVSIDIDTSSVVSVTASGSALRPGTSPSGLAAEFEFSALSASAALDANGNGLVTIQVAGSGEVESSGITVSGSASLFGSLTISEMQRCDGAPPPPLPPCCNFAGVTCGPVDVNNPLDGSLRGRIAASMAQQVQFSKESPFSSCPLDRRMEMIADAVDKPFDIDAAIAGECKIFEPSVQSGLAGGGANITHFAADQYDGATCSYADTQTDTTVHLVTAPRGIGLGVSNGHSDSATGFTERWGAGFNYQNWVSGSQGTIGEFNARFGWYNTTGPFFRFRYTALPQQINQVSGNPDDPNQPFVTIPISGNQAQGELVAWPGNSLNRRIVYDVQLEWGTEQSIEGTPTPCGLNLRFFRATVFLRFFIGDTHPITPLRGALVQQIAWSFDYDLETPFVRCEDAAPPESPATLGGCSGCRDAATGGLLL